ncbi:MAG TPA: 4'-phosphopantetheinyl transferase superfamily protein [Planctomycetota bacterium]|nr:4'-phosphopantetheinyl transferase superfamily protein [Planctomycetota bacterium]
MADRLIHEASLTDALLETFSLPILACVDGKPIPEDRLSPGEREDLAKLTAPVRRESWLRGRAALKRLLGALGKEPDTSTLRFPNPQLSLTHSESWAVAIGLNSEKVAGLGVDLELKSIPKPETARKFLNPSELVWLRRMDEADHPRLLHRLWTVKEALFKADPENAGNTIRDYALADPGFVAGRARRGTRLFHYASFEVPEGFLSVAVLPAVE